MSQVRNKFHSLQHQPVMSTEDRNPCVLLTETDREQRLRVSRDLKESGYEPVVATDSGTHQAKAYPACLGVIDRMLPGESGHRVVYPSSQYQGANANGSNGARHG